MPLYGCLLNTNTNQHYILPDAVYTGGNQREAELMVIYGNNKKKRYTACGYYHFFHRTFEDAVNYNRTGQHHDTYINRHALFVEGKMYLEPKEEFGLDDDTIATLYSEPCIIICYTGTSKILLPDMLVKKYDSFTGLTYHKMSKKWLEETADNTENENENKNKNEEQTQTQEQEQYMIA